MIVGDAKSKKVACLLALLVAGISSIPASATSLAERPPFQQILPLYSVPPADNPLVAARIKAEQQHRFNLLITGAYGKPEDFTARARLSFKGEKRAMVDSRPFSLQVRTQGPIPGGWHNEGQSFWWRGTSEVSPPQFTIPVNVVQIDEPFRLADYDEIWLDYSIVPGVALCTPQLELRLAVQPTGRSFGREDLLVRTGAWSAFKVLFTIDAAKSNWEEKDYGYLVRRELGLAPDDDWRYTQDGQHAVLQRRMHKPLDNVEMLDISVAPGIDVEQVNLRFSSTDSNRGGEVVQFAGLLHSPGLPDVRPGVRLNLRDALEKRFAKEWAGNAKEPGKFHFYLQEVTVFVPGDARTLAHSNPF